METQASIPRLSPRLSIPRLLAEQLAYDKKGNDGISQIQQSRQVTIVNAIFDGFRAQKHLPSHLHRSLSIPGLQRGATGKVPLCSKPLIAPNTPYSLRSNPYEGVLIRGLDIADKEQTFSKFLSLPAELREMVCTLYLEDLDQKVSEGIDKKVSGKRLEFQELLQLAKELIPLAQPPLTRVSRLLRQETIPLFYQLCTFGFGWRSEMTAYGFSASSPAIMADRIPETVLEQIQKIRILSTIGRGLGDRTWWQVEIGPGKTLTEIVTNVTKIHSKSIDVYRRVVADEATALPAHLESCLQEIMTDFTYFKDNRIRFEAGFVRQVFRNMFIYYFGDESPLI